MDDGLVVSVGGGHPQQLGVVASGRLSREGFFVAHGDRVFWVEVHDPLVLDVNARDAVARGGHDEGVVEPDVPQSRSDFAVPLLPGRLSQAEVPFADGAGDVARGFEQVGQRILLRRDDHAGVARGDSRTRFPPRVLSREQAVARRRAGRCYGVDVREPDAFACGPVRIRRGDGPGAVAGEVAESEVVGVDDDDVGRCGRLLAGCRRGGEPCRAEREAAECVERFVHGAIIRLRLCRGRRRNRAVAAVPPGVRFLSGKFTNYSGNTEENRPESADSARRNGIGILKSHSPPPPERARSSASSRPISATRLSPSG